MKLYRSRLFDMDRSPTFKPPHAGRGWRAHLRTLTLDADDYESGREAADKAGHSAHVIGIERLPSGRQQLVFAPELIIEAPSRAAAQRAVHLICSAKLLRDGGDSFPFGEFMPLVLPDNPDEPEGLPAEAMALKVGGYKLTHGFGTAAALAAKASQRRTWTVALAKYGLCCRYCTVGPMDLDPNSGQRFSVSQDPHDYLVLSHALFTAFSAIEDLGLKLVGKAKDESGAWDPAVLAACERALAANRIPPDAMTVWHARGTPSRIQRRHPGPPGIRAPWGGGPVRDREVRLPDAIHYSQLLRNKVTAHAVSDLTRSLTVLDVINVRELLRRILLHTLGFWGRL